MKQRRVGTLSMGLLLISVGILLIYAQISALNALELVETWWPIILFMLGIEVLWWYYTAKEETPKIKYDLLSIFIILFLIFTGTAIYSLSQVGVVAHLHRLVSAQHFVVPIPTQELPLDKSIKKIVVDSSGLDLNLRTGTTEGVAAYGNAFVVADSRQTAEKLVTWQALVDRQIGDTLYLSFDYTNAGSDYNYHARIDDFTLILPGDRQIEVESHNYLEVNTDRLTNRLAIEGEGVVQLNVPEEGNCRIKAFVQSPDQLGGNVEWNVAKKHNEETVLMTEDAVVKAQEDNYQREQVGEITIGDGQAKITVISRSKVKVNKI